MGVIVNVTSSVALAPSPFAAAYTATKTAIEGFSRALQKELVAFSIGIKLVDPSYAPTTRFSANTQLPIEEMIPQAYADFARPIFEVFVAPALMTWEIDVAETI